MNGAITTLNWPHQYRLTNDIDVDHGRVPEHLQHLNPHTFEIEDLKMLILKTSSDLHAMDEKRKKEFKVCTRNQNYHVFSLFKSPSECLHRCWWRHIEAVLN